MTDWETIVERHGGIVWQTIFRLVGDRADAADCFQETFLKAVEIAPRGTGRDWPALLRRLAVSRALDFLRARYRRRRRLDAAAETDTLAARTPGPEDEAEAAELAERLRAALADLPAPQAEAFCLVCLHEWSYGEAAALLGATANAVGSLTHRARRRLREALAPRGAAASGPERGSEP
jgi:RNA polymerase sigma-70 factor, ECF subfamily